MDEAIRQHLRRRYGLTTSLGECERVRKSVGVALQEEQEHVVGIRGLLPAGGFPGEAVVTSEDIRAAVSGQLQAIVQMVRQVLEKCPPELASGLLERGMVLTGGASQLKGLDRLLGQETRLPVAAAADPLSTVAQGLGRCLEAGASWDG